MKKYLFLSLFVIGFFGVAYHAEAATLFSWTQTTSNIVINPAGGQAYTNGSGGGCTVDCSMTASGDVHNITLKFKSESTRGAINITMLNDLGSEVDCVSSDVDTTSLSDGDTVTFSLTGTQCNVLTNDIKGIKFNLGSGSSASNITWYGGADDSVVGKIYQVWDDGGGASQAVVFLNPTASSTQPSQFNWQVQYSASSSVSAALSVNVCPYLTNCPRSDRYLASFIAGPTPATATFFTITPLSPGTKTAVATLSRASNGEVLATSSVTFFVGSSGAGAGGGSVTTSTTFGARIEELRDSLTVDCSSYDFWTDIDIFGVDLVPWPNTDDWFPGIYCYAKKTVYAGVEVAVVPHDYTLEFFDFALAGISDVFPFNAFFAVKDSAQLAASGVVGDDSTWTLPAIGNLTPAMPIVTSSTLSDFIGSSNRDLLFQVEEAVMWAGAGALMLFMVL